MTITNLRSSFTVGQVRLVSFVELDAARREHVRCWRNAERVRRWMYTDHEIGVDEHRRFMDGLREDVQSFWWLIAANDWDLGAINVQKYNARQQTAYCGFFLNPELIGRGLGWVIAFHGLWVAFEQAKLTTVKAECLADNSAAIGLLTRSGFHREGTLRSFAVKDGRRTDVALLGVLASEWPSSRERLRERAIAAISRLDEPQHRPTSSGAAAVEPA